MKWGMAGYIMQPSESGRRRDPQHPAGLARMAANRVAGARYFGHYAAGTFQIFPAERGERKAARSPADETYPEIRLERSDLLRYG